jgi:hypothetical protein
LDTTTAHKFETFPKKLSPLLQFCALSQHSRIEFKETLKQPNAMSSMKEPSIESAHKSGDRAPTEQRLALHQSD